MQGPERRGERRVQRDRGVREVREERMSIERRRRGMEQSGQRDHREKRESTEDCLAMCVLLRYL